MIQPKSVIAPLSRDIVDTIPQVASQSNCSIPSVTSTPSPNNPVSEPKLRSSKSNVKLTSYDIEVKAQVGRAIARCAKASRRRRGTIFPSPSLTPCAPIKIETDSCHQYWFRFPGTETASFYSADVVLRSSLTIHEFKRISSRLGHIVDNNSRSYYDREWIEEEIAAQQEEMKNERNYFNRQNLDLDESDHDSDPYWGDV